MFGLSPDDIDWLRKIIHVRRQVKIVGGRRVFAPPKGGKDRDVPLADGAGAAPVGAPDGVPGGRGDAAVAEARRQAGHRCA